MQVPARNAGGLPIGPGLSLYLDLLRAGAALAVVFCHLGARILSDGRFWPFALYGAQAVDVFFVLSGYVIAASAARPGVTAAGFARARLARLYSVALPAILLTALCDLAGQHAQPALYRGLGAFAPGAPPPVLQYLAGGLFCHQLWWLNIPLGSNRPWWSLGYEPWYYAIFAASLFARGWWRILLTALMALACGPQILALLPLWLAGAAIFAGHRQHRVTTPAWLPWLPWLLWLGYAGACVWKGPLLLGLLPGNRPELAQDWLVGGLFALHLHWLGGHDARLLRLLYPAKRAIRAAAGVSFTLYAVHFPIMLAARSLLPMPAGYARDALVLLCGLAGAWIIAQGSERRHAAWRASQTADLQAGR